MSTASAGNSSDPPQHTSHQPGALALLAATALGGVLATRMGKTPFVLAAGAAAYALLKQKTAVAPPLLPSPEPLPLPEPPLEIPAPQSQVEQWLSQQITREEQAPVIDFSSASLAPPEPEDDYRPPSFLIEEADEFSHLLPSQDSFAGLTEPVPQPLPTPAPPQLHLEPDLPAPGEPFFAPLKASDFPSLHALESPVSSPAAEDAAWTLGVEPLPSLNEAAPSAALASSMFFTAPIQQEELEPPPVFFAPVFEGAAFPDEIQVAHAPAFEPIAPAPVFEPVAPEFEPIAHVPSFEPTAPLTAADLEDLPPPPLLEPEPPSEAPPVMTAEPAPEISVQLAAPGEASFDSPLAAAPENPWEPKPDAPVVSPYAPPSSYTSSPVVDAEIILRPRAPMQNSVTAKSKFSPQDSIKKDFAETFDDAPAGTIDDVLANLPPPPSKPRSWRSWWRGD